MQYIIAHDLGTSGDKATLFNESGKLISSSNASYNCYYPKPNWVEQDPDDWWNAVCLSTKDVLQKSKVKPADVIAITFSGQMMGCLPVNKNGVRLSNSIIWADSRSTMEADTIRSLINEDYFYQITGTSIAANYSLEKMMWLKNNANDIYKKTACFLNAKDYIVLKLTGKFATDYSDASSTNLFDIKNKKWSDEIISAAQIDKSKLPEPHPSTDVIGCIIPEVTEEIGLTCATKVVIGGGDGPCATVGAGAVKRGDSYNYFGSSSWISVTSDQPLFDPKQRTFNFCHLDPSLYMCVGTMQSAGGSYEWLKENFCTSEQQAAKITSLSSFRLMDCVAEKSSAGSHNILFLPYLLGERCPYWDPDAKGAFVGLTRSHNRADIIRSVYEGPIFNLRIILDIFREQGIKITDLCAIGGAVKSDLIARIMADIFEVNILRTAMSEEATSFGAAVCAGVGIGLFKDFKIVKDLIEINSNVQPDERNVRVYRKLYPIFKNSYEALISINKSLSALKNGGNS